MVVVSAAFAAAEVEQRIETFLAEYEKAVLVGP